MQKTIFDSGDEKYWFRKEGKRETRASIEGKRQSDIYEIADEYIVSDEYILTEILFILKSKGTSIRQKVKNGENTFGEMQETLQGNDYVSIAKMIRDVFFTCESARKWWFSNVLNRKFLTDSVNLVRCKAQISSQEIKNWKPSKKRDQMLEVCVEIQKDTKDKLGRFWELYNLEKEKIAETEKLRLEKMRIAAEKREEERLRKEKESIPLVLTAQKLKLEVARKRFMNSKQGKKQKYPKGFDCLTNEWLKSTHVGQSFTIDGGEIFLLKRDPKPRSFMFLNELTDPHVVKGAVPGTVIAKNNSRKMKDVIAIPGMVLIGGGQNRMVTDHKIIQPMKSASLQTACVDQTERYSPTTDYYKIARYLGSWGFNSYGDEYADADEVGVELHHSHMTSTQGSLSRINDYEKQLSGDYCSGYIMKKGQDVLALEIFDNPADFQVLTRHFAEYFCGPYFFDELNGIKANVFPGQKVIDVVNQIDNDYSYEFTEEPDYKFFGWMSKHGIKKEDLPKRTKVVKSGFGPLKNKFNPCCLHGKPVHLSIKLFGEYGVGGSHVLDE